MKKSIKIVDSIMGSGKTSAAINFMNEAPSDERFMFVTPFLDEVDRIVTACADRHFVQPSNIETKKTNDLKALLQAGKNIVTTHTLFMRMNESMRKIVADKGYTLVLDETLPCISTPDDISPHDIRLIDSLTACHEDGRVEWLDKDYYGVLDKFKRACERGTLFTSGGAYVRMVDPDFFGCFNNVVVLTYMFNSQLFAAYCDFFNIHTEKLGVKGSDPSSYQFCPIGEASAPDMAKFRGLITLYDHKMRNTIDTSKHAFSHSWYMKKQNAPLVHKVYNSVMYFYRREMHAAQNQIMWTVYEECKDKVAGRGYIRGFVPCNARAINTYGDRDCVAYLINRYVNPFVGRFINQNNLAFDKDGFALSEMLQWLFRSALRNDKPITLYMPCKRMRDLLAGWLELPDGHFSVDME